MVQNQGDDLAGYGQVLVTKGGRDEPVGLPLDLD